MWYSLDLIQIIKRPVNNRAQQAPSPDVSLPLPGHYFNVLTAGYIIASYTGPKLDFHTLLGNKYTHLGVS